MVCPFHTSLSFLHGICVGPSLHRLFPVLELLHYFFVLECSSTTSYVQFSLIYGGYLSKSSSLGDADAFSNYCHPRYELRHLCLSSYWSCLFFSWPFFADSYPRKTAISIHVVSFVLGHTLLSSQDFVSCFLLYHLQPKLHLTSEMFYQTDSTDKWTVATPSKTRNKISSATLLSWIRNN